MEADEYGLTRGACFVTRSLDIDIVVRFGRGGRFSVFFDIVFLQTDTAYCKHEAT